MRTRSRNIIDRIKKEMITAWGESRQNSSHCAIELATRGEEQNTR